jgi:hypothetical protein
LLRKREGRGELLVRPGVSHLVLCCVKPCLHYDYVCGHHCLKQGT